MTNFKLYDVFRIILNFIKLFSESFWRDRQTDRQTDRQNQSLNHMRGRVVTSYGKNWLTDWFHEKISLLV